jgi:CheY-like chemotaxis protein
VSIANAALQVIAQHGTLYASRTPSCVRSRAAPEWVTWQRSMPATRPRPHDPRLRERVAESSEIASVTTVLIADDEPNLRILVNATIASEQYSVIEAADGDEAWQLLLEHKPAVALLDVQMPGRSGLDLTRAIRSEPQLSATHVILLTSQAQEADVQAGLAAGADRYLTKPFSPLELLTVVEEALGLGS